MPYVVASQTVPLLAIAPMVVIWLGGSWFSVAVIAAYLTFFPVTINTLQGLRSPEPTAVELMHSYAASSWGHSVEAAGPRCPALHFYGPQSLGHGQRSRRNHRRTAQRHRRRPGPGNPQLQPILRHRAGKAVGLDSLCFAHRHGLLPRHLLVGTSCRAEASL